MSFSKLFNPFKKQKTVVFSDTKRIRVLFHRDAAGLQTHGALCVSHADYDLDNNPIRFSFIGLSTPPALTIDVMEHLWQEAHSQGFIVHALLSYGDIINATPAIEVGQLIQRLATEGKKQPHTVGGA